MGPGNPRLWSPATPRAARAAGAVEEKNSLDQRLGMLHLGESILSECAVAD